MTFGVNSRPLSVTILAYVYMAVGAVGFAYHLSEWDAQQPFQNHFLWVELVRLAAILFGAYMLRGRNWARWLALAWIGYHVILSAFHTLSELAMHAAICVLIAWILFRALASRYFRASGTTRSTSPLT